MVDYERFPVSWSYRARTGLENSAARTGRRQASKRTQSSKNCTTVAQPFCVVMGSHFQARPEMVCLDVPRPTLEHSCLLCACQGRQVPLILKRTHHLPQLNAVELLHPFLTGEQVGRESPEEPGPWPPRFSAALPLVPVF